MKNLPYILQAILFILVIGLYVLHFQGENTKETVEAQQPTANKGAGKGVTIAYINMDTLFANYKYYEDLSDDFTQKRDKAQKSIEQRGRKLEKEVISFQRRAQAGLMSQNDIRATEETLLGERQELEKYTQTVSAGLMEEEAVLNEKLYDKIQTFLEEYNKTRQYDVVINYVERSPTFWYAGDALDITKEVVDSLNVRYEAEKQTETAE